MSVLAIVPARSGSKELPDKNIKRMCGKPLMAYTIEAALKSGVCDCVHVSTDSKYYADIAKQYGADVPFLRKSRYATDNAKTWDVVKFVLDCYEKMGEYYNEIVLLQPTSPLRDARDIREAYSLMKRKDANAVVAVCETSHSPLWTGTVAEDGNMRGFVKKKYRTINRQKIPTYYRVNGAIYCIKKGCLERIDNLYDDCCYAYVMSKKKSIDIDDEVDFLIAEAVFMQSCISENVE